MMNTEIIRITEENKDRAAQRAGEILRNGGIVAFPTDTVYGLGAVCTRQSAVRKIFEAKTRPENKPLSILVSSISQVLPFVESVPLEAEILMKQFWPGALTVILKKAKNADIPEEVTAGGDTIGFRMPKSGTALRVIEAAGMPLAAPSANLSGKRSAVTGEDVIRDLDGRCDMILDGGCCPVGISSTVADLSGGNIRILREGSITREMMELAIEHGQ